MSRRTVKNKIHRLEFPKNEEKLNRKKEVDYLYIDADEDHIPLQFREKRGDLTENENHRKNNCLITKLVYIYEEITEEQQTLHGESLLLLQCEHRRRKFKVLG